MVDVRFCDLPGVMQHFTVPVGSFTEDVFTDGLGFDGSSIRGFQAIHESDMQLLPDPTTARIDPFRTRKTLILNFFIHDPLTGEQYSRDPRNVAKKAEAYLKGSGIADTAFFGAEAEFYIFDSIRYDSSPEGTYVTSTPRRRPGTPARTCRAATSATSPAPRAATSRSPRPTTTPTCATRWPSSSRRPAWSSSAATTRSARPARPRSTTASARCSRAPTT
jgi:glutamine synthetase